MRSNGFRIRTAWLGCRHQLHEAWIFAHGGPIPALLQFFDFAAPISVALDCLTAGVTLTNRTGRTVYTRPDTVYADVSPSNPAPGATTDPFTLMFSNPKLKSINYTPRVLGSSAPR